MKRQDLRLIAAAAALVSLHGVVRAEDPPAAAAAAAPEASPLTFNVGVISDYRYRGISQTRLKPALQGGIDYAFSSGFYVGTWASTIKWIKDAGTIAKVDAGTTGQEIDLYGGYKGDIIKDSLTYDVGGLYYLYAGNHYDKIGGTSKADTFEVYGALTYMMFTAKYSLSTTNLFGTGGGGAANSKGSGYLDLSANFDLGNGFSLTPHIGHQQVAHYSIASYTDYALTLGKDFGNGFSLSATVQGTDDKKVNGVAVYASPDGKNLGKSTLVVGAKYSF